MLIDSFLDYLRYERNYSEMTVTAYRIDLVQFEEFVKKKDAEVDFTVVDADVVRAWIVYLMDKQACKSTSVNRKLSSLRTFYHFLMKRKVVAVNPMIKVVGPKKKKPLPSFLKEKDMDRLLDEIPFGEDFEGCRDRMILEMFAVSLGATFVLETLVMILIGEHSKKNLLLLVLINILTNPMAVYLSYVGRLLLGLSEILIQLPIEIGVILVESGIYTWFSKDENWKIKRPILLGILTNVFSWSIGLMM